MDNHYNWILYFMRYTQELQLFALLHKTESFIVS